MNGQQMVVMRKKIRLTGNALAEYAGVNPAIVCHYETGAGKVSRRARDKIVGTILRLRDLQKKWRGALDMRNIKEVRTLLMSDGKPVTIPQDTDIDDIAKVCLTLMILPAEFNQVCGLRDGLLATARFFSRPAQRWVMSHVVAVRDVLAESPDLFAAHRTRSEAVAALAEGCARSSQKKSVSCDTGSTWPRCG
jgi:hypothetical protein